MEEKGELHSVSTTLIRFGNWLEGFDDNLAKNFS